MTAYKRGAFVEGVLEGDTLRSRNHAEPVPLHRPPAIGESHYPPPVLPGVVGHMAVPLDAPRPSKPRNWQGPW